MKSIICIICGLFFTAACKVCVDAQPVYRFTVKIGIDKETTEHLGGENVVRERVVKMFETINRAFNYNSGKLGITGWYDFVPDMDSLYIFDGSSRIEIDKPHPYHDYLVIMDGYRNYPDEGHGGWFGSHHQTIGHDRGHVPGEISDPFDETATDGIIHEFGHARGIIDLYAANVDAKKNPINGQAFNGIDCIMNYCYGVRHWSSYAVNILNLTKDKSVNVDDVIANLFPAKISVSVKDWRDKPVKDARIKAYPVSWYSYAVQEIPAWEGTTTSKGVYTFTGIPYMPQRAYGFKYINFLIEAEHDGIKTYGWMPLYLVQNAFLEGEKTFELELILKKEGHELFNEDLSTRVKK